MPHISQPQSRTRLRFLFDNFCAIAGRADLPGLQDFLGSYAELARPIERGEFPSPFATSLHLALSRAAAAGDPACLRALLAVAKPDHLLDKNPKGDTALHAAAKEGNAECARMLLDACPQGVEIRGDQGWTPLLAAIHNGRVDFGDPTVSRQNTIELLFPLSDLHARDKDGRTALHLAALANDWRTLNRLLPTLDANDQGEPDRTGNRMTPLMLAAVMGSAECVERLLPVSDPALLNRDGRSALGLAGINERWNCADLIAVAAPAPVAAQMFQIAGAELMPRWAAQLEAKELREAAFSCEPAPDGSGRSRARAGKKRKIRAL